MEKKKTPASQPQMIEFSKVIFKDYLHWITLCVYCLSLEREAGKEREKMKNQKEEKRHHTETLCLEK
jgi:hypothetical protein